MFYTSHCRECEDIKVVLGFNSSTAIGILHPLYYGALHLVTATLVQVQNRPANELHRVSVGAEGAEKLHKVISPPLVSLSSFFCQL